MTRVLPKAYLRIDPNIDHTHPDNLDGFIRMLCAANRQPRRGWFRSRAVLDSILGKTAASRLFDRGDVVATEEGVDVPGWALWQEGDMTVGERVRRYRALHEESDGVTETLPDRIPASDALGRKGVRAEDVGSSSQALPVGGLRASDGKA